jgi:hypothetical protein
LIFNSVAISKAPVNYQEDEYSLMTRAEGFLKYFEMCKVSKKFKFTEYFDQRQARIGWGWHQMPTSDAVSLFLNAF